MTLLRFTLPRYMLPGALLLVVTAAFAGDSIELAKPVPADAVVTIENMRGDVEIRGWDRDEVKVTGELDDLADGIIFDVDGRNVLIEVEMPRRDVNWGDGSDLVVRLPRASRVSFKGVSTDVTIEGVTGGARLRTVSGDIEVGDVGGQLLVNSVSGDVEVSGVSGRASVSTISGDIEIVSVSREMRVDTVSGDVEVDLDAFERLDGRSVSGSLEMSGRLLEDGNIELGSVSGDIRLDLASPVNAEMDVQAGIGGDIYNDITDEEPETAFPSRQRLIARAGNGRGRIRIETVSADVRLN